MTPLELGSHPNPTQIAEALVYLGARGAWSPAYLMKALEDCLGFGGFGLDETVASLCLLEVTIPPNSC